MNELTPQRLTPEEISGTKWKAGRPQLVHNARQSLLARIAKYNDPHNLEWKWDDVTDKWERHALSAVQDLVDVEAERDALLAHCAVVEAEAKRVYTPSIIEAMNLLDAAGYGKEVPNSLAEMIKKVIAEVDRLKAELKELKELKEMEERQNGN